MYRDYYCGEPTENLVNKEITISGWVNKRRDHGGLLFIDLRDRTGLIQVVFDPENLKEGEQEQLMDVTIEDFKLNLSTYFNLAKLRMMVDPINYKEKINEK